MSQTTTSTSIANGDRTVSTTAKIAAWLDSMSLFEKASYQNVQFSTSYGMVTTDYLWKFRIRPVEPTPGDEHKYPRTSLMEIRSLYQGLWEKQKDEGHAFQLQVIDAVIAKLLTFETIAKGHNENSH